MRLNLYKMADNPRVEKLPLFKRRGVKLTLISMTAVVIALGGMTGYLWRHAIGQDLIAFSAESGQILLRMRSNPDRWRDARGILSCRRGR